LELFLWGAKDQLVEVERRIKEVANTWNTTQQRRGPRSEPPPTTLHSPKLREGRSFGVIIVPKPIIRQLLDNGGSGLRALERDFQVDVEIGEYKGNLVYLSTAISNYGHFH